MAKRSVIWLLILTMICSLCACGNKQDPVETKEPVGEPATYEASLHQLDSWKVEEDGKKTYYNTFFITSDDFFDMPTEDDFLYLTDRTYAPFKEFMPDAQIDIYHINGEEKAGIAAYIKLTTHSIVDVKKVYMLVGGPAQYHEGVTTKQEYVEKNGSAEGWHELYCHVSSRSASDEAFYLYNGNIGSGAMHLISQNRDIYIYNVGKDVIVDGDHMVLPVNIIPMKNSTYDDLTTIIQADSSVAAMINNEFQTLTLDERLQLCCYVEDDVMYVGYKTVDGSNFADYDGNIPDVIVYDGATTAFFPINMKQ